ncbi:hypothetical protein SteCoe_21197 [Stentor coeruleus]|uniref:Uncharacterized protein n=1 Tax=Stentor coeruleus TaxID=5963 RepID=A0A1R2BQ88_9CILI|nr:hypothetical protein SteCoe_21197 [Stentor coeruleus]
MKSSNTAPNSPKSPRLIFSLPKIVEDLAFRTSLNFSKPKASPKMNEKIKLLEEFGLAEVNREYPTNYTTKTQTISVVDFSGKKDAFLKRTGYWDAYKKLQNSEKFLQARLDGNLSKPDKPYIMDINLKRKVLFEKQRVGKKEHLNPLPKSPRISKFSSDLEEIAHTLNVPGKTARKSLQTVESYALSSNNSPRGSPNHA